MKMFVLLVLAILAVSTGSACAEGTGSPASGQEAKAERSTLHTPAVIEGVPCDAGYVWRFTDGRLHRCTIDRDATVRGAALPKGSAVAFKPDGSHEFVFLPRTTDIEGFQCRGHGHDFMTTFHPDGRLKLCWMPENRDIRGIPCAAFSFWSDVFGNPSGVYLHPNGALAECRLSRDVTVGGVRFQKNDRIVLDPSGAPGASPQGKPRQAKAWLNPDATTGCTTHVSSGGGSGLTAPDGAPAYCPPVPLIGYMAAIAFRYRRVSS